MKIILRIFYILRDAQNTNFTYTNYLIENKSSTILTKYFAIKQKKIFHFFFIRDTLLLLFSDTDVHCYCIIKYRYIKLYLTFLYSSTL